VTLTDLACGVAILVGLVGIVVPILPGTFLMLAAIVIWAAEDGGRLAWSVAAVAALVLLVGQVVKYALPGRRLKATVPTWTLLVGGVAAVIGFFVVPIVGAFVGFPLGVYVAERVRVGGKAAWPSTKAALHAIGVSILIEFLAGVTATAIWLAGVVAT
jgi:uncharacterized protein